LIIDDSPLSSEKYLQEKEFPLERFYFHHRENKSGVGSAHLDIISFATSKDFDVVITMDGDGTHSPKEIPKLLEALKSADVVIGSRFLSGGDLLSWTLVRRTTTKTAHLLTKFSTNTQLDCTSGIRAYNLQTMNFESLFQGISLDYRFFYQSTFRLVNKKVKIEQVPVVLESRNLGKSNMSLKLSIKLILGLIYDSTKLLWNRHFIGSAK
jgi:dolichol-phosphate mannosyltransferase